MTGHTDTGTSRIRFALYAVAVVGSAALGALLSVIAVRLTGSAALGNSLLGATIGLGIYPVLADRAQVRGVRLPFWSYAAAFVLLAFGVNFLVDRLR